MIQVTIGNNLERKKVTVDPNATLREILNENEIDYATATLHLDGCSLNPGDLDATFTDLGITGNCYLLAVIKADNAYV